MILDCTSIACVSAVRIIHNIQHAASNLLARKSNAVCVSLHWPNIAYEFAFIGYSVNADTNFDGDYMIRLIS